MTDVTQPSIGERIAGGAGAALMVGALGGMLLGLAGPRGRAIEEAPDTLIVPVTPPAPPPSPRPARARSTAARQAPAPANLRRKPIEIVAPPVPPLLVPPPILAAPVRPGAADRAGPGTGAGGIGNGLGGGGTGDGDGGDDTPPRLRRGRFDYGDMPAAMRAAGVSGTVGVEYAVETDGRVRQCSIDRSSGDAELDALTCGLIVRRFRFDPSRTIDGTPVRSTIIERHTWVYRRSDPDDR